MAGRPKKPIVLHQLQGTGRKNRLAKRVNELRVDSGPPEPPTWLEREAKAEWRRLCHDPQYGPALAKIDRGILTVYCQLWSKFVAGERSADPKDQLGGRQLMTLIQVMTKLGINPVDRTKVQTPAKPKAADPWAKLG